jgi:hypothetical protein
MIYLMNEPTKIVVIIGKYKFQIIDNTLISNDTGQIYNRSFKIGGNYSDCIRVDINEKRKKIIAKVMV